MMHHRKISVTGLGYVGLAVAAAFGQKGKIIGFDNDSERIAELRNGYDKNQEISTKTLSTANIILTTNSKELKKADFHIITVPTPVDSSKRPDFTMLQSASLSVGKQLKKGDIVVYESTVYPGATEEICLPILENASKLICGKDFFIGYSPERIDPGNKNQNFSNTIKIVSGQNEAVLNIIASVYESVVAAGVYRAPSIRVAEAAKVLENTQRDLNISLINEIALIMHRIGVDTQEVLKAAETKWNFIHFYPGFVGGHCISVDPYYLTYKAEAAGYHPEVILAGRRVNDHMGKFIAATTVKQMIQLGISLKNAKVAVLGMTFKENCPDFRNTKVLDMIKELQSYGLEILTHDPLADPVDVKKKCDIKLVSWDQLKKLDAIILAVAHTEYYKLDVNQLKKKFHQQGLIMDIKGILDPKQFIDTNITYWRL